MAGLLPTIQGLLAPYTAALSGEATFDPTQGLNSITSLLSGAQAQPGPSFGGAPVGGNSWEQVARRMALNRYGYTPEDFNKLDYIISHESNWNPNAVNQSSGAFGIPQILPSAHPGALGLKDDPYGQLRWLFNYVNGRYGGIDAAYAFKQQNGWY